MLAEKTRAGVGELATSASEQTVAAARMTAEWATKLAQRGELTETAKLWLKKGAELSQGGIEAVLAKGQQAVPTALAIGGALATAVDSDTMIEPIYQPIGQAGIGSAAAEAAIRGMAPTSAGGCVRGARATTRSRPCCECVCGTRLVTSLSKCSIWSMRWSVRRSLISG